MKPLVRFSDDRQDHEDREVDREALPERLAARRRARPSATDDEHDHDGPAPARPVAAPAIASQLVVRIAPAEDALRPDEQDEDQDRRTRPRRASSRATLGSTVLEEAPDLGRHGARRQQVADPGQRRDEDLEEAEDVAAEDRARRCSRTRR